MIEKKCMQREFKNPPNEYRPAPFWFLNAKLEPEEMIWQIREMKEKGLGGFFLHAREGLETEYLSDDWFCCLEVAIVEAKKLGMKVWLYDEYPYPSGIGGLKVTAHREYRCKFIDLVEKRVKGPMSLIVDARDGEILEALAVKRTDFPGFNNKKASLRKYIRGNRLEWQVPEGEWVMMAFIKRIYSDPSGNIFAPDYLNSEAMEFYFATTHEVYRKKFSEHFGETIVGIFTDEPCILPWHQTNPWSYRCHHDGRIAAWADAIPQKLKEKYGFETKDILPAVFYDCGPQAGRRRRAYREVVSELFLNNFLRPYQRWCKKNNLLFTGHFLQEEGLYSNLIFTGNYFDAVSCFDIPGVDHLQNNCETEGSLGQKSRHSTNIQGQKLISSIAHLQGKDTVLSETYGASGWGLDFKDMKRIADWQYTLGINFLCPHAFYYSIEGFRKGDFPPSLFYQSTYWKYHRKFSDYIARLSCMLRGGVHQVQVALVYPLLSFETEFKAGPAGRTDSLISDFYDFYASLLIKMHYDYDIIQDCMIIPENIKNGALSIGQESYRVLLFPPVTVLSESSLQGLEKFIRQGGCIIFTELCPGEFPATEKDKKAVRHFASLLTREGCYLIKSKRPCLKTRRDIKKILDREIIPGVEIDRDCVSYIHKKKAGLDIYLFLNNDKERDFDATIRINNGGKVRRWDAETGRTEDMKAVRRNDTGITIEHHFCNSGSLLITIEPWEPKFVAKYNGMAGRKEKITDLGQWWDFEPEADNALILDRWNLHIESADIHQYYRYENFFYLGYNGGKMALLLDDVEFRDCRLEKTIFQVEVNGSVVPLKFGYRIDKKFKALDISPFLKKRKNRITLEFHNMAYGGVLKTLTCYPKLLGKFEVERTGRLVRPSGKIKIGDWGKQGYPFLSGTGIYSKKIRVNKQSGNEYILKLTGVRDAVEVIVNGKGVKVMTWDPFDVDISRYLKNGDNRLVLKVTNSLANFIEGVKNRTKKSGLTDRVKLIERESCP